MNRNQAKQRYDALVEQGNNAIHEGIAERCFHQADILAKEYGLGQPEDVDMEALGERIEKALDEDEPCCYGWVTSRGRDHEVDCHLY